jgi:hypothetical protein
MSDRATEKRFFGLLPFAAALLLAGCGGNTDPKDWGDYDLLRQKPARASAPVYNGKQVPEGEYLNWVHWGEQWFRGETFGNERLWTDIVGVMNGTVDVAKEGGAWRSEPVFRLFLEALDAMDSVRGNLYTGNGGAYTNDLVIAFPRGSFLDKTIPIPEKVHTGLDVEAGSAWPLGIVPVRVAPEEEGLPYLFDPGRFASGPKGVGPLPGGGKFRAGMTCALCHYSLDVDWDGKPDLKSAKPSEPTENSPYQPSHAWAISNQDVHLGWIFSLASNSLAGFENSGAIGKTRPEDAPAYGRWILENYKTRPEEVKREVDRGVLMFPRGFADDTPDGLHNPLQFPSLFTHMNWPFNYDGVMLDASDRNNNVWTTGLDLSQLVALCSDRGGKTAKLAFWEKPGIYSVLTARQFADIIVTYAPAVLHDPSQQNKLVEDILGESDGIPGVLDSDAMVLVRGVPGTVPKELYDFPENRERNRIRTPDEFGTDGKKRGPFVALLGTRVVTPSRLRQEYNVDSLQTAYGINGDEWASECVNMMLDWVEPPPNTSLLLANARTNGLVEKGYNVFKQKGCVTCHAGPYTTDNLIHPLKEIGTNDTRASATDLIQQLAPPYDPATGKPISGGVIAFISNLFGKKKPGYKTVTLRYLWGSAPYLHDGGVAVALRPGSPPPGDDIGQLLQRPDAEKLYGTGQILLLREAGPDSYLRPNAALSLQALLLKSERDRVTAANLEPVWPVPGTAQRVTMASLEIQGGGHEYWIEDRPGGDQITALVAFLLALDDDPGN